MDHLFAPPNKEALRCSRSAALLLVRDFRFAVMRELASAFLSAAMLFLTAMTMQLLTLFPYCVKMVPFGKTEVGVKAQD